METDMATGMGMVVKENPRIRALIKEPISVREREEDSKIRPFECHLLCFCAHC